jgi:hypothetical protein
VNINADNFVVRAGGQKFASRRKANCVYCPRVVAHGSQLLRLIVRGIPCVVYCFCGPYANMAVCTLV